MSVIRDDERADCRALARLGHCNPFLPERIECERAILGPEFVDTGVVWSAGDSEAKAPNVARLAARAEALVATVARRLGDADAVDEDVELYENVVAYVLYSRYEDAFYDLVVRAADPTRATFWDAFRRDAEQLLGPLGRAHPWRAGLPHLFACFFQVRRAFHHIFRFIIGRSMSAARLRAAVWQSVFTHDTKRYRRTLYAQMGDVTTLITGPSGTGKELVAQAIGLSRYLPFDPKRGVFPVDFAGSFQSLNLAALSPTLIESELFGHKRGAFTGALEDRVGWLESSGAHGTVLLDEIGDLDLEIQVKLLRALQSREIQRLGESRTRRFEGKIIAATNRDLAAEMAAGRFRDDLYYRLCADTILTPSLRERVAEDPQELESLVRFLAGRVVGANEAEALTGETLAWITANLGTDYAWPGNVRELEQCVRNILIRQEYRPASRLSAGPLDALADGTRNGTFSADELLRRYCTVVFARAGSYQEAARRLGLDRRTVKAKVDPELLRGLRAIP